jgi:hypothetical protein
LLGGSWFSQIFNNPNTKIVETERNKIINFEWSVWQTRAVNRLGKDTGQEPAICREIVKQTAGEPVPWGYSSTASSLSQPNIINQDGRCFSIAYRNTACLPSQDAIEDVASRMEGSGPYSAAFFQPPKCDGQRGAQNLRDKWQEITDLALEYNFNPIFIITMWIEESAAGGCFGAYQMGCMYKYDTTWENWTGGFKAVSPFSSECEQLGCLVERRSADPKDFANFACNWAEGKPRGCKFIENPNWSGHFAFWYNELTNNVQAGTHPISSCRLQINGPGC